MSQYPQRIGEDECRDYLRTGRCKYGESCKYHHPPNVQSGGGIKTPLDPSEPPFPIRPTEPPCQYFLKHGTCKFGQTCKFHHPPSMVGSGSGGVPPNFASAVLMSGVHVLAKQGVQPHILINSNGSDISTSGGELLPQGSLFQFLPQRPGQPDCMYFLRNGRCKYGATCKYHHPLPSLDQSSSVRPPQHHPPQMPQHQGRIGRGRSVSTGSATDMSSVGSVQLVSGSQYSQQHRQQFGAGSSGPTHILLADGPIAVMTVSQASQSGLQPARLINSTGDGNIPYCQPANLSASTHSQIKEQHHTRSDSTGGTVLSSSVASSYDTAASSLDFIPSTVNFQHADGAWVRDAPQQQGSATEAVSSFGPFYPESSEKQGHGMYSRQRSSPLDGGGVASHRGTVARSVSMLDDAPASLLRRTLDASLVQPVGRYRSPSLGSSSDGSAAVSTFAIGPATNTDESQEWPGPLNPGPTFHENDWGEDSALRKAPVTSVESQRGSSPGESQGPTRRRIITRYPERGVSSGGHSSTSHSSSKHPHNSSNHGKSRNVDDDGLSLMTTALLTILDESGEQGDDNSSSASAPVAISSLTVGSPSNSLTAPQDIQSSSIGSSRGMSRHYGSLGQLHGSSPPTTTAADVFERDRPFMPSVSSYTGTQSSALHEESQVDCQDLPVPTAVAMGLPSMFDDSGQDPGWSPTWQSSRQQLERNAQSVVIQQATPRTQAPQSGHGFFLSG